MLSCTWHTSSASSLPTYSLQHHHHCAPTSWSRFHFISSSCTLRTCAWAAAMAACGSAGGFGVADERARAVRMMTTRADDMHERDCARKFR